MEIQVAMKKEWIEICDAAEAEMIHLADTELDMPIGVAFVDDQSEPGWIGRDPSLQIHRPSLRGCWPTVRAEEQPTCTSPFQCPDSS
jgi:hypothetical protein